MLRKDVKIGFAVGGILIATLIAYVITAGRGTPKTVELAEGDAPLQVQPAGAETPAPQVQPEPEKAVVSAPEPKPETTPKPADPFQPSNSNARDVWATALNSGTVLMSVTPSAQTSPEPAVANGAATTTETRTSETPPSLLPPSTQPVTETKPLPTVQSTAPRSGRSHTVQKGETLTMIAIAAYGDQKYWKQIAAANPSINPNKLKIGTTVTLPDLGAKKAQVAGALNGGVSAPVSSRSQYEVQSGDSLRRIAIKLYGKEAMWQQIYELNKSTIGADPARLKLHTLLKLPQGLKAA
jgi:nucleoid-associated protein YgaU